ncbi:MAG: SGNH/GDSL hydrolase family protein [Lentisphaeria bacterium]|nr:SGNH/GDSL hydrolase family protein [Lentisphaeria bacterium]
MKEFFTPEKDKLGLRTPQTVRDDLPMVLLVGDSISCGYTEPVMELLRDVCNVRRAPDNCGDTRCGLDKLDDWLGETDWDLIHFNWGLHDLCHRHPSSTVYGNRDKINGPVSVPIEEYADNLDQLVRRLSARAPKLIWASTTFVPPNEAGRFQGDDRRYNEVAADIMRRHGIPVNDLHALTAAFDPSLFTCPGDVHFSDAGTRLIAKQVASSIRMRLP